MSLTIGANTSLNWLLALERRALMRICHFVHWQHVAHELHGVLQTIPERRVPRAIDKLMVVHEESLGANDAVVATDIVSPPVLAREGTFHRTCPALRHEHLVRGQLFPKLFHIKLFVLLLPFGVVSEAFELVLAERLGVVLAVFLEDVVA